MKQPLNSHPFFINTNLRKILLKDLFVSRLLHLLRIITVVLSRAYSRLSEFTKLTMKTKLNSKIKLVYRRFENVVIRLALFRFNDLGL